MAHRISPERLNTAATLASTRRRTVPAACDLLCVINRRPTLAAKMTCSQKSSLGCCNVWGGAPHCEPRLPFQSLSSHPCPHRISGLCTHRLRSFAPVESHTCTATALSILSQWPRHLQLDGWSLQHSPNEVDRDISRPLCSCGAVKAFIKQGQRLLLFFDLIRHHSYHHLYWYLLLSRFLTHRTLHLESPTMPGQGASLGYQQQPWPRPAVRDPRQTPCRSRTRTT